MYKAIISDYDGTLASKETGVCERNKKAITELVSKGFRFALCTGRMTASAMRIIENLPIRPLVGSYNGSEITDSATGEKLYSKALTVEEALPLIDFAEERGANYQLYNDTGVFPAYESAATRMYSEVCGCPSTPIADLREFLIKELKKTPKFMIIDECADEILPVAVKMFADKYEIARCYDGMIDFTPKGVNKGSVVRALSDIWKIAADEIIAIGDECNDIPMLKAAGLGVATLNAGETVKKNAGYVTAVDCGKGAVAEVIERFIL